jgi:hypothetical protein
VAEILRSFDLSAVMFATTVDDGAVEWWVELRPVLRSVAPDPMDLDEATDYIDSHWDREAEDRDGARDRRRRDD